MMFKKILEIDFILINAGKVYHRTSIYEELTILKDMRSRRGIGKPQRLEWLQFQLPVISLQFFHCYGKLISGVIFHVNDTKSDQQTNLSNSNLSNFCYIIPFLRPNFYTVTSSMIW